MSSVTSSVSTKTASFAIHLGLPSPADRYRVITRLLQKSGEYTAAAREVLDAFYPEQGNRSLSTRDYCGVSYDMAVKHPKEHKKIGEMGLELMVGSDFQKRAKEAFEEEQPSLPFKVYDFVKPYFIAALSAIVFYGTYCFTKSTARSQNT